MAYRTFVVVFVGALALGACRSRVSSALVIEHPIAGSGDRVDRRTTPYEPGGCGGVRQAVPRGLQPDERVVACVEKSHLEPARYPAVLAGIGIAAFLAIGTVVLVL
jgi:hypothetical protein